MCDHYGAFCSALGAGCNEVLLDPLRPIASEKIRIKSKSISGRTTGTGNGNVVILEWT